MRMHNPPHPGEFIHDVYMLPLSVSARQVARLLDVAPSTFSRLLRGQSQVTPEMALRLAKTLGRSPESWLTLQQQYDLWQAQRRVDLSQVGKLDMDAA